MRALNAILAGTAIGLLTACYHPRINDNGEVVHRAEYRRDRDFVHDAVERELRTLRTQPFSTLESRVVNQISIDAFRRDLPYFTEQFLQAYPTYDQTREEDRLLLLRTMESVMSPSGLGAIH